MNYLISILPILLYLLGIKAMDALSFTSWKRLGAGFLAGVLSCAAAFGITRMVTWNQMWIVPLLEESLKALFIIYIIFAGQSETLHNTRSIPHFSIAFFAEAIVYGMAVGAGFSFVENVLYVSLSQHISLVECGIRGFGTALIHMGCTALVATLLLTSIRSKLSGIKTWMWAIPMALAVATSIHITYNLFLIPPAIQLFITIIVFVILFMGLYQLEETLIYKWLDISITDDIDLLGAIKEGKLEGTHAGEYLIGLRSSFKPEVFFDMLVFLQLYMELSIKAKSRLILRDADLNLPIPAEEHEEDMQRLQELSILRKNIGIAGLYALSPLIHEKNTDTWVINELL